MPILLYPVIPRRRLYSWNKWIYGLRGGMGRVGVQVGNIIVWKRR